MLHLNMWTAPFELALSSEGPAPLESPASLTRNLASRPLWSFARSQVCSSPWSGMSQRVTDGFPVLLVPPMMDHPAKSVRKQVDSARDPPCVATGSRTLSHLCLKSKRRNSPLLLRTAAR